MEAKLTPLIDLYFSSILSFHLITKHGFNLLHII